LNDDTFIDSLTFLTDATNKLIILNMEQISRKQNISDWTRFRFLQDIFAIQGFFAKGRCHLFVIYKSSLSVENRSYNLECKQIKNITKCVEGTSKN